MEVSGGINLQLGIIFVIIYLLLNALGGLSALSTGGSVFTSSLVNTMLSLALVYGIYRQLSWAYLASIIYFAFIAITSGLDGAILPLVITAVLLYYIYSKRDYFAN